MARIPEVELERLKREVSVERLVQARGIDLRPHGANLIGLCPFHADHEPSLVITPANNLWHCLGACQAGGSVVDFVMRAEGVSFRHAVELLRGSVGSSRLDEPASAKTIPKRAMLGPDVDDRTLMREVVRYYHATLKQSAEALRYLESRGLGSAEMINRFEIGYANRTLGYRLPGKHIQSGAGLRGRLEHLGLLRSTGHEHFVGSIVIPITDAHGAISEIYGRRILANAPQGVRHLYLPGPHRGVWNLDGLNGAREVILCEALFDALTFWSAGLRNVTASYGVEGFNADHLEALKQHTIERVLIAYDRDDAGNSAATKLAAKLQTQGIGCFRVEFPKGMDANDYALRVTPASRSLAMIVRQARWLGSGPAPAITSVREGISVEIVTDASPADDEASIEETAMQQDPPSIVAQSDEPPSTLAAESEALRSPPQAITTPAPRADEIVITIGDRRYRVRGLAKNTAYDTLRVNLQVRRGEALYTDSLDLYAAKQRAPYAKQAAEELGLEETVIKKDLGQVLAKLEELQDQQIRQALEPADNTPKLSEAEHQAAMGLLKDPQLLDRILADFERCGVVGEETNKLIGYLAAVSRLLDEPLAVIVQSSSAAGKSSLMDAILAFVPEEQRVKYSAMTGQSLFYLGETDLRHKILAIVEEAGAERASYALKLLQSEGELTIASTGKDPESGKLVTHQYHVAGPVMIMLTTTAIEIDEELLNRCLVLTVNEEREQTRAIHRLQRERQTLEGLLAKEERREILALHQNAQRLLRPMLVANPYARELTFLDTRTRTRRDHMKYLTLIRAIALLHQYQRPMKAITRNGTTVDYIEVTRADIATANRLAHEVLGRSLDELAPQTRRLLQSLEQMVSEACARLKMDRSDFRFSRKDVRAFTEWSDFQVKVHMKKLEELEYVLAHRGGRGQSFVYELLYSGEGNGGRPFLMGLIDPDRLEYDEQRSGYDEKKEHFVKKKEHPKPDKEHRKGEKEHPRSPQVAPKEHPSSIAPNSLSASADKAHSDREPKRAKNAYKGRSSADSSYRSAVSQ